MGLSDQNAKIFEVTNIARKVAQLVEQRFPKPKDEGSNPFFPGFFFQKSFYFLRKSF